MGNYVIVKDENNNDIKIEIILTFKVEEYNKQYIAYTINDDNSSETVAVFISEINRDNRLVSIPGVQKETVLGVYEIAKNMINE